MEGVGVKPVLLCNNFALGYIVVHKYTSYSVRVKETIRWILTKLAWIQLFPYWKTRFPYFNLNACHVILDRSSFLNGMGHKFSLKSEGLVYNILESVSLFRFYI